MRALRRQLLREFGIVTALGLAILATLAVGYLLLVSKGRDALAFLTGAELASLVALVTSEQLGLILPLLVTLACVSTYGRARAAGEIEIQNRLGTPLRRLLGPAMLLGVVVGLALFILQDEAIPAARRQRDATLRQKLPDKIEALLARDAVDIRDARFRCRARSALDAEGKRLLRDLVVTEDRPGSEAPRITRAREAIPEFDAKRRRLHLHLRGLQHDGVLASEELTLTLDLSALAAEPSDASHLSAQSYGELRSATPTQRRPATAELHGRWALGLYALTLAGFGALLGMRLGGSPRLVNYGLGLLSALLFGLLPHWAGRQIAASEWGAPLLGIYAGPALSAALGLALFLRMRKD
jgi:lipopolysaccharide export LptBFGC system permease protein LptF